MSQETKQETPIMYYTARQQAAAVGVNAALWGLAAAWLYFGIQGAGNVLVPLLWLISVGLIGAALSPPKAIRHHWPVRAIVWVSMPTMAAVMLWNGYMWLGVVLAIATAMRKLSIQASVSANTNKE